MTEALCEHYSAVVGARCGAPDARAYIPGPRCAQHTPAALAGRAEVHVDPELTLGALQKKAGRSYYFRPSDTALLDYNAIQSGKRKAGRHAFHRARNAAYEDRLKREGLKG